MRGNYPEARTSFRRAIAAARRAGSLELRRAAHHGLLFAAAAARDIDLALAHGWAAVNYTSPEQPDDRAETLVNLAGVGCLVGAHRAALGACLSALELTDTPRVRLTALGTAVRSAAALGETRLVAHLAQDVERTIGRSGQPFENARVLIELAEVLVDAGDPRAGEYAARAGELARAGAFHEISLRAERAAERMRVHQSAPDAVTTPPASVPPMRPRTARARSVLRSMEALPAAGRYASKLAC